MPFTGAIYTAGSQVRSQDLALLVQLAQVKRSRFPAPIRAFNFETSAAYSGSHTWLASTGLSAAADIDLDIPQGMRLSTLRLWCKGNGTSDLTIRPVQVFCDDGTHGGVTNGPVPLGALSLPALSATQGDQTLSLLAASSTLTGGQTVSVTLGGGSVTYTRSAGSYVADGFFVGQIVQWSGFVNAANNATATIIGLSATGITIAEQPGQVAEVGVANAVQANGVSPVVDSTFGIQLQLTTSDSGIGVRALRYDCVAA